jgi:hypothetical protein
MYTPSVFPLGKGDFDVVVTGPRRGLFDPSLKNAGKRRLRPYFAAPYGDMMITGCYGLLAATADVLPDFANLIKSSLYPDQHTGTAPWDAG